MPDTTDQTAVLGLPYILPAQAQKHVTHNEALRRLDALVQLRVTEFFATEPPADPEAGTVYALDSNATGVWAGHDGALAVFSEGAWDFITPREGWLATSVNGGKLRIWQGGLWRRAQGQTDNLEGIGIGGVADATNRLLVSAEASLFTHDGGGHQIKVNKNTTGDTASLLFQTGYSGRAEMGLAGGDNWSIKTSANGSTWVTALSLNAATGIAGGSAVQASRTDTTPGRLMRADYGYGPGNLLGAVGVAGGVPTGAVLERGNNANGEYTRFADGTMMCSFSGSSASGAAALWTFPSTFSVAPRVIAVPKVGGLPRMATTSGVFTGQASFYVFNNGGTQVAAACDLFAYGRWF